MTDGREREAVRTEKAELGFDVYTAEEAAQVSALCLLKERNELEQLYLSDFSKGL